MKFQHSILYALVLAFVSLPATTQNAAKTYTLPFKSVEGLLLVTVKVNGKPLTMIVDTGAVSIIVSAEAAGSINDAQVGEMRKNKNIVFISGSTPARNVTFELDSYKFNQSVTVLSLKELNQRIGVKFDGILGEDFLNNFHTLKVDYKAKTVELTE